MLFTMMIGLASVCGPQGLPRFEDVSDRVGFYARQRDPGDPCSSAGSVACQMGFMSGGFAVGDINGDGWPDVYMTSLGRRDQLLLNMNGGYFVDIAGSAGLAEDLRSNGARFVDIDNDGDDDLVVTVIGDAGDTINNRHRLYVNRGALGFVEEGVSRGLVVAPYGGVNGWSIASGDYDRDGWVDLYICKWYPEVGTRSILLRNRGAAAPGFYEDATSVACLDGMGEWAFGAAFADMDSDGWQDLVISGDFGSSRMLWNNGDGTFSDGTQAAGVGTDENGMGSTIADVDGDGDLDWFVSAIYEEDPSCSPFTCNWASSGNRMFVNLGERRFGDATDAYGVRNSDWGWGSAFFDLENDGDADLVSTNGVAFPLLEALPFHADHTRLWENRRPGHLSLRCRLRWASMTMALARGSPRWTTTGTATWMS